MPADAPRTLRAFLSSARSDQLPWLREYLAPLAARLSALGVAVELRVVVDSSTIIADIRWLARARDASARTALQEAATSGVIRLFAPSLLLDEVSIRIDELEKAGRIHGERARRAWAEYRKLVHIVHAKGTGSAAAEELRARDPTDLPFLGAADAVGAAGILTKDRDLLENSTPTFSSRIEFCLRDYARSKTVELNIVFLGCFSLNVSARAVGLAASLLKQAVDLFARLPSWVKLVAVAGCALALSKREWRESMRSFLAGLKEDFGCLLDHVEGLLLEVWELAIDAHRKAQDAERAIAATARPNPKLKLRQAIDIAFASADGALSIDEIEADVRHVGYASSAANIRPAIKRYLRSQLCYEELNDGSVRVRASSTDA